MTSARRWIQKLSRKALTDVGYNITLDSTSRANCDYDIRANNRKPIAQHRNNLGVMEMRDQTLVNSDNCSSKQSLLGLQCNQAIDELRNFKERNVILQDERKCGPQQNQVSWTQHFFDDNQTNMIWKVKHYQFATILTTTYWCTKISSMAASTGIFLAWMKTWEQ